MGAESISDQDFPARYRRCRYLADNSFGCREETFRRQAFRQVDEFQVPVLDLGGKRDGHGGRDNLLAIFFDFGIGHDLCDHPFVSDVGSAYSHHYR